MYPLSIRVSALCFLSSAGRIGATMAQVTNGLLLGMMASKGVETLLLVTSIFMALGGLAVLFLNDTTPSFDPMHHHHFHHDHKRNSFFLLDPSSSSSNERIVSPARVGPTKPISTSKRTCGLPPGRKIRTRRDINKTTTTTTNEETTLLGK
jgi:hypothetical protein